jgi:hypothetical protein
MSVGGKVGEVMDCGDVLWVNTIEPRTGVYCAIYVEKTAESRSIGEGDSLWWQGPNAYWTPRSIGGEMPFSDREIRRRGYSGISREQALQRRADYRAVESLTAPTP